MHNKNNVQKPHVIIGTVGHVDHSKSELKKIISEMIRSHIEEGSIANMKLDEQENNIKDISLQKRRWKFNKILKLRKNTWIIFKVW